MDQGVCEGVYAQKVWIREEERVHERHESDRVQECMQEALIVEDVQEVRVGVGAQEA